MKKYLNMGRINGYDFIYLKIYFLNEDINISRDDIIYNIRFVNFEGVDRRF